jgi:tetratricopeptide (TPR) repeat protein
MTETVLTEKLSLAIAEGNDHYRVGDFSAMLAHYKAIRIFFEDSDAFHLKQYLINLGIAYHELGFYDEAINEYMRALAVEGDEIDEITCGANLGDALLHQGRSDEALTFLAQPERYFRGSFNRERLGEVLETKARALLALNRKFDALAAALEAVNLLYEFVMDPEATKRDVTKSFSRAVNTFSVCTFEELQSRQRLLTA